MTICLIAFGPIRSQSNGYFIRSYQIAKYLEKLDDVIVLEFPENPQKKEIEFENKIKFVHLRGNEGTRRSTIGPTEKTLSFRPIKQIRFQLNSIAHLLVFRKYVESCRVVFVEGSLIPFAAVLGRLLGKKVVLDTHGVNKRLSFSYGKYNRLAYLFRTVFWHILESATFALSHCIIFVSENEKRFALRNYKIPAAKIFVIPIFHSSMKRQEYSKQDIENLKENWGLQDRIAITFIGDLTSVQNKDAVDYILNELATSLLLKKPEVSFLIIGKGKENFSCDLPNVVFTGYVEDVSPFLQLSDICIAPLRVGCGVKTKVLQYLAHGKPIVATPIGMDGIEIEEPNAIIRSDIATFEKTLLRAIRILSSLKKIAADNGEAFERRYSQESFQTDFERCVNYVTKNF